MAPKKIKKNVVFIMPYGDEKKVQLYSMKGESNEGITENFDFDKSYSEFEQKYNKTYNITIVREHPDADIYRKMYRMIHAADIVVADITGLQPNVMYELGARHALREKVTLMVKRNGSEKIPFDFGTYVIHKGDEVFEGFEELVNARIKTDDSPIKKRISNNYNADKEVFDDYNDAWKEFIDEYEKIDYEKGELKQEVLEDHEDFKGVEIYDQKLALNTYKMAEKNGSNKNERLKGLKDALEIIAKHNPMTSRDFETLGLYCSILERIYKMKNNDSNFRVGRDAVNHFISAFKDPYSYGAYAKFLVAQMLRDENLQYFISESKIRFDELNNLNLSPVDDWIEDTLKQYKVQAQIDESLTEEDFDYETSKQCFRDAKDAMEKVKNG